MRRLLEKLPANHRCDRIGQNVRTRFLPREGLYAGEEPAVPAVAPCSRRRSVVDCRRSHLRSREKTPDETAEARLRVARRERAVRGVDYVGNMDRGAGLKARSDVLCAPFSAVIAHEDGAALRATVHAESGRFASLNHSIPPRTPNAREPKARSPTVCHSRIALASRRTHVVRRITLHCGAASGQPLEPPHLAARETLS